MELDTLFRDVASVLSEKCINPDTRRPYTISMLERGEVGPALLYLLASGIVGIGALYGGLAVMRGVA